MRRNQDKRQGGGRSLPVPPPIDTGTGVTQTAVGFGPCRHCGALIGHGKGQCPKIAAIDYYPNGTIKRVEYHK